MLLQFIGLKSSWLLRSLITGSINEAIVSLRLTFFTCVFPLS